MHTRDIPPIHPGEFLQEYLTELNITPYALAKAIKVDPRRIQLIIHGKRSITADTSLRLGRFFGQHGAFWLKAQMDYDVDTTADFLGEQLERDVMPWVSRAQGAASLHAH